MKDHRMLGGSNWDGFYNQQPQQPWPRVLRCVAYEGTQGKARRASGQMSGNECQSHAKLAEEG